MYFSINMNKEDESPSLKIGRIHQQRQTKIYDVFMKFLRSKTIVFHRLNELCGQKFLTPLFYISKFRCQLNF